MCLRSGGRHGFQADLKPAQKADPIPSQTVQKTKKLQDEDSVAKVEVGDDARDTQLGNIRTGTDALKISLAGVPKKKKDPAQQGGISGIG
tara:strand:+ start:369 stop:638 length:270 start_codon:yes stop_codon:yes gene_type:complete